MKKKSLVTILVVAIVVSLLTGCGSSKMSETSAAGTTEAPAAEAAPAEGMAYENATMAQGAEIAIEEEAGLYDAGNGEYKQEAMEADPTYSAETSGETPDNTAEVSKNSRAGRKLITTMNISAETESFDELMGALEGQIAALGGYIESSDQWNGSVDYYGSRVNSRNASLKIRIPAEKLDGFVAVMEEKSNVTRKERSVEDVTLAYVDLESHKKALLAEQERLLELLEMAETVEDLISIEDKLANVRYQLESMESQLRTYDNQINYSTVYLDIQEVKRLTPPEELTIWGRIRGGFAENVYAVGRDIENFLIDILINIPYILLWLVILAVVLLLVFLLARHEKKKKGKRLLKRQKPKEVKVQGSEEMLPRAGDSEKEASMKEIEKEEHK